MNKKISAIVMALLVAMVGIPSAMADDIPATTEVLECTLGISVDPTAISFGSLYPGESYSGPTITKNITAIGNIGGTCKTTIDVTVDGTDWIGVNLLNSMPKDRTVITGLTGAAFTYTTTLTNVGSFVGGTFGMSIPDAQAVDTYSQTITVTGTY